IAEGEGKVGEEGAGQGDVRSETEEHLVGGRRDEVFLDEQLHAVGERLQPAELAADARRAEAVLDTAGDLAFEPYGEDGGNEQETNEDKSGKDPGQQGNVVQDREQWMKHVRPRNWQLVE